MSDEKETAHATVSVTKNTEIGTRYSIEFENGLTAQFTAPKGSSAKSQERLCSMVYEFIVEECGGDTADEFFEGLRKELERKLSPQP